MNQTTQKDRKLNIICLSNQLWDFPNWTNKKHVMTRLAKQGHNVVFVDPPINLGRLFIGQIKRGLWDIKRIFTQTKKDTTTGALIFTPINTVPSPKATTKQHVQRIKTLSKKYLGPKLPTVLWVYHVQTPELQLYLDTLKYDILIYDCVDNYEGFPEASLFYSATVPKQKVVAQEKKLAERADLVFASAPGLVEKLKKYNERVYFTPNVGDYEKFSRVENFKNQLPEDLAKIKRPRVGFAGALDQYKFDSALMRKTAQDHPNISFILIGQIALKDQAAGLQILGLHDLPNVYHLGQKPYEELDKYYAGFDAYIIPYQLNDYTVGGCFPVKFHDALAAGLPTVVTNLPAYMPFSDVSYISDSYDIFSQNVQKALDEDNEEKIIRRKEVAKQNSWDGKVKIMLEIINSRLNEK